MSVRELYETDDPWFVQFAQAVVERVREAHEEAQEE